MLEIRYNIAQQMANLFMSVTAMPQSSELGPNLAGPEACMRPFRLNGWITRRASIKMLLREEDVLIYHVRHIVDIMFTLT